MEAQGRLETRITRDREWVRQAQRLRYSVFAGEMGARLPATSLRIDEDRFDAHCEHLVVIDRAEDRVVATYRILAPDSARRAGGYYSEASFRLELLDVLRDRMVEVGRACVHPAYRSGNVMLLLWSALTRYLVERGHDYFVGSASIGLEDGGHAAASIYHQLCSRYLSPEDLRVFPRRRLALETLNVGKIVQTPPLLKGYLNMGAWICGEPSWDPEFDCADFPILLPLARMHSRYARHFLAKAA